AITYRRTLAVDSENVDAHYNLGRIYGELARADLDPDNLPPPEARQVRATPERLDALVREATDPKAPAHTRKAKARDLAWAVAGFAAGPRPQFGSKLEPLLDVVERVGPAFARDTDPVSQAALAGALAVAHQTLHVLYKPDETAEGRAIGIARSKDRA